MPCVLINCPSRLGSVCVVWSFNSGLSLTTCYRLNDLHVCVCRTVDNNVRNITDYYTDPQVIYSTPTHTATYVVTCIYYECIMLQ